MPYGGACLMSFRVAEHILSCTQSTQDYPNNFNPLLLQRHLTTLGRILPPLPGDADPGVIRGSDPDLEFFSTIGLGYFS